MIHSMTAFARESSSIDQGVLFIELRSVNHRYLDCSFKLPDLFRSLEPGLREALSASLSRGKVECFIRLQSNPSAAGTMEVDEQRLEALLGAVEQVQGRLDGAEAPDALSILAFPGIYTGTELAEDVLHAQTKKLFDKALASLQETRRREGEKLSELIGERLDRVAEQVSATREIMPQMLQRQRDKVIGRIAELEVELDESRLEQELVYMAQKADVEEELDRLDTHVAEVRRTLKKGGPCGRRLDFLMQELNREANTLSSKSQAASTTHSAVELKVLIEQMREQIQNIE